MRDRGFRCSVASLAEAVPLAPRFREEAVEVHCCHGRGGWDFRVLGRLRRIIEATRPAIVHALLFHANVAARRAARQAGLPPDRVVCEIQTVEVERWWHLLVDRWTHGGCRFTIGNSPSVVEHLVSKARIPRSRLRLVRGGIDPAALQQAKPVDRAELGVDAVAPIVLWVGRLDPVKGLEHLIDAFRVLADRSDAHLFLVGDGPLRGTLERRIAQRKLASRAHLLGTREDVPGLLKAADVFAFPSRTEGLPNALLEAMASGCAIVTTDVPGCRDLITHEETGLVVPYRDTEALTDALDCLIRDRDMRLALGRRAAEVVEHDWHIERTWAGYAAAYDSILVGAEPLRMEKRP